MYQSFKDQDFRDGRNWMRSLTWNQVFEWRNLMWFDPCWSWDVETTKSKLDWEGIDLRERMNKEWNAWKSSFNWKS